MPITGSCFEFENFSDVRRNLLLGLSSTSRSCSDLRYLLAHQLPAGQGPKDLRNLHPNVASWCWPCEDSAAHGLAFSNNARLPLIAPAAPSSCTPRCSLLRKRVLEHTTLLLG